MTYPIIDRLQDEADRDRERIDEIREENWLNSGNYLVVIEQWFGESVPKLRQLIYSKDRRGDRVLHSADFLPPHSPRRLGRYFVDKHDIHKWY